MTARICTVDGCERPPYRRQPICTMHYQRKRRNGTTDLQDRSIPPCSIEGCDRPNLARTWCSLHYDRWLRNGDPLTVLPNPAMLPGDQNCKWQDEVAYGTAHRRVRKLKGAAEDLACADCGAPADEWSYDHLDPDELVEGQGAKLLPYSLKPEHYQPRCRSCHWYADRPAYAKASA